MIPGNLRISDNGFSNVNDFNDFTVTARLTAVPEPTTSLMFGCAMVGVVSRRRKKRMA